MPIVSVGVAVGGSVGLSVAVRVAVAVGTSVGTSDAVLVAVAVGLPVAVAVGPLGSVGVAVDAGWVAVGVADEELESSSLLQAANAVSDSANTAIKTRWRIWLENMDVALPPEERVSYSTRVDRASVESFGN
jgi:hypothetical protein